MLSPFGVRWQSEATTALWIEQQILSKAVSRYACHRTPQKNRST
jgi:hypothetical protein